LARFQNSIRFLSLFFLGSLPFFPGSTCKRSLFFYCSDSTVKAPHHRSISHSCFKTISATRTCAFCFLYIRYFCLVVLIPVFSCYATVRAVKVKRAYKKSKAKKTLRNFALAQLYCADFIKPTSTGTNLANRPFSKTGLGKNEKNNSSPQKGPIVFFVRGKGNRNAHLNKLDMPQSSLVQFFFW